MDDIRASGVNRRGRGQPRKDEIPLQKDLEKYLRGDGTPKTTETGSNFGAMCERIAAMGVTEIHCPACRARDRKRRKRRDRMTSQSEVFFAAAGWTLSAARAALWWYTDTDCRVSGGTGRMVVRITAGMTSSLDIDCRPTGSSKHGKPPDTLGDCAELEKAGKVGNLLVTMQRRDPDAYQALLAWYRGGTRALHMLMDRTDAGRMLLQRRQHAVQDPASFFAGEARRREQGYSDHIRDRLYEQAEAEARLLLDSARDLWTELAHGLAKDLERRRELDERKQAAQELGRAAL